MWEVGMGTLAEINLILLFGLKVLLYQVVCYHGNSKTISRRNGNGGCVWIPKQSLVFNMDKLE
jgi:hypothetical protein